MTNTTTKSLKPVGIWLLTTAAFVFAMAVIGAITRLTESGLSMVEWRPLVGALPPLTEIEWQRVFDLYRDTAEYQHKNTGMSLDEFQYIFFWEWFHRFWGRLIGLVFFVPMVIFWARGYLKDTSHMMLKPKLLGLLFLGACQAIMGWYMVMSGLADIPSVSHYRLAAHLGLAFVIFFCLIWVALDCLNYKSNIRHQGIGFGALCLVSISLTVIWGAFVAGTDSGLIYNSFPKMGDTWLPAEAFQLTPIIANFFENHAMIQFSHRILAYVTVGLVLAWSFHRFTESKWFVALGAMVLIQMSLGIVTLLSHVAIPVAAMHQAGAFILVAIMAVILHQIKRI